MSYQPFYQDNFSGGECVIDGLRRKKIILMLSDCLVNDEYAENHTNYESTTTTGFGVEEAETFVGSNANFETNDYNSNNFEQQSSTNYPTNSQGLYQDPNPEIVRRPAAAEAQVYTQRVIVKFLQPPPVPPPGVNDSNKALSFICISPSSP
jgi:hypothetical protein